MKRSLLVFMSLMLVLGILAGCSTKSKDEDSSKDPEKGSSDTAAVNKEGFPIVDEKITLSIFGPNVGVAKWEEMKYFQEMEKKTNVAFKFNTPPNESFETQKNLLFASNELPDIFYGASLTNSDVTKYSEQKLLMPIEDLIEEYAPNITAMLEKYPDIKKTITALDGHIYTLPAVDRTLPWNIHPMWYNGDFLEALDVKELPKTTDELYDLLVRFKTEDPNGNGKADEIPLTAAEMWDIRQWFMGFFGLNALAAGQYDGVIKYGAIQPEYKEYLEYMNKLWEADLFDHEAFSQTGEQKAAKGKKNQVGLFANWGPGGFRGTDEVAGKHPMMQPVTGPNVDKPVIPLSPGQSINQFAMASSNKNPEASIRWIDYSYSPEGAAFLHGLDEGDVWDFTDKEKTKRKMQDGAEEVRGKMTPAYGIPVPMLMDEGYNQSLSSDYDAWRAKETEEKMVKYGVVALPQLFLTAEELDSIAGINADIVAYVEQMEAKFITGATPFSEWDKYVKTAEDIGVEKIVEVYQKAYDRYAAQ